MYEELFPPRQIRQVRPEDSVDEVLDAMAQVGADIRKDAEVKVKVTFHGPIAPDDNGEPLCTLLS